MTANDSMQKLMDDYIAHRRRMGYQFKDDGGGCAALRSFARYADEIGHKGPVTVALAVQWALRARLGSDPTHKARRLRLVRGFCQYQFAFDPATEIPPRGLLGSSRLRRRTPYIYSDAEVVALVQAASSIRPSVGGLGSRTYGTVLGLLACTGLRVSEALTLSREDVDLPNGVLTLKETKTRKCRLVPLHASAVKALCSYADLRDRQCAAGASKFFFVREDGRALTYFQIGSGFRRLRRKLKWCDCCRVRRPRIHDLRHTFAVRRLLLWYKEGANIDQKIMALSTYLGHVNVTNTYWYLTAVPELLAVVSSRFQRFSEHKNGR